MLHFNFSALCIVIDTSTRNNVNVFNAEFAVGAYEYECVRLLQAVCSVRVKNYVFCHLRSCELFQLHTCTL